MEGGRAACEHILKRCSWRVYVTTHLEHTYWTERDRERSHCALATGESFRKGEGG